MMGFARALPILRATIATGTSVTIKSIAGIDHAVIAVKDLDAAASNWKQLGFTISPRGTHSAHMGTGNYTIMLRYDYMELLGVLNPTKHNEPTRAYLEQSGGGIERVAFTTPDAAAGLLQIGAARSIVLGRIEHAEQLHVIFAEHDGVVAGAHMGAVGAAWRYGEAELFPAGGGRVQVLYDDDGVIDSGDALDGHACTLSLLLGTLT